MKKIYTDPFEQACWDYYLGDEDAAIKIISNKAEDEIVPVKYFFRDLKEMPEIEKMALDLCQGEILDIGAGSGCHSLELNKKGHFVSVLEIRKRIAELLTERGIRNIYHADIFKFKAKQFDTLLLLMNGIGLVEDLYGLDRFLSHAKSILRFGGQILMDSSDLMYLYQEEDNSIRINLNEGYYGEVEYKFVYNTNLISK
ncbi:MAG: class I SAM-dependent methyltransferase [Bacteroidales bacterium]|nr:class I SAM-dependent methyltransferase [Bacteroidales bacterium]